MTGDFIWATYYSLRNTHLLMASKGKDKLTHSNSMHTESLQRHLSNDRIKT
jgi:hypothetical protein